MPATSRRMCEVVEEAFVVIDMIVQNAVADSQALLHRALTADDKCQMDGATPCLPCRVPAEEPQLAAVGGEVQRVHLHADRRCAAHSLSSGNDRATIVIRVSFDRTRHVEHKGREHKPACSKFVLLALVQPNQRRKRAALVVLASLEPEMCE